MPEILKKIAPHVTRVTVIYSPQQVPQVGRLAAVQMAAPTLGLQVSGTSVAEHAIEKLEGESDRGVIVLPAPVTLTNRSLIITRPLSSRPFVPSKLMSGAVAAITALALAPGPTRQRRKQKQISVCPLRSKSIGDGVYTP